MFFCLCNMDHKIKKKKIGPDDEELKVKSKKLSDGS